MLKIMLVDDDRVLNGLFRRLLEKDYDVTCFYNASSAKAALCEGEWDLIITDVKMPDGSGLDILRESGRFNRDARVLLMTGYGKVDDAVKAMKDGAADYLLKPVSPETLLAKVKEAEDKVRAARKVSVRDGEPIYKSAVYGRALDLAARVAPTDATVLITGETGSGKGVMAGYIHNRSGRADKCFVSINCANLQESIFESELFGYKKGAFTGAGGNKAGIVASASGGTLFLDEIGEVPMRFQAKLLKFLEDKSYLPVGSTEYETADARIIAATNRDLEKMVAEGAFRLDLYYRLNVINICVPPLRDRREDIVPLARFFVEKYSALNPKIRGFTEGAENYLTARDMMGNARELSNIVERAMILENGDYITEASVNVAGLNGIAEDTAADLKSVEKKHILKILDLAGGDKSKAASLLKIDRTTLYRKLKEYGLV